MRRAFILALLAATVAGRAAGANAGGPPAGELVHLDDAGVVRWNADNREVALFGANYSLASACDYRAAGLVGADRKKLVEKDLTHFARMGWDAMRLCLWGDWENSDARGNLIVNDHLDVMDYAIAEAKKRGIYILFTPITTYAAWWPDGKATDDYPGFSNHFAKSKLGTDPAAIAAQQNYLRQILRHVNPYTGVALKDEPQILFVEMINEPWHHPEDPAGSVAYIDALVDAVRSTGCRKILFHNLSQDFRMAPMIAASRVQGFSFAWYPTALLARRTLDENYLRWVDHYTPLLQPGLPRGPRIVYEFDSADMVSGYLYPAMVRSFREAGAQFATMFSYDMLDTAPYNLGWQTHYLNLVYTPRKAVSAIIAAEAMRTLPRGVGYGDYPANRRFGPFRVSYEDDLSKLVTRGKFFYDNDTATAPPDPAALEHVVGLGRSPVVGYEGRGSYFLDKLGDGQWRLEVYPDALFVQDPFAQRLNRTTVSSRLVWRTWPMRIALPNLGPAFSVIPLNAGNPAAPAHATNGTIAIRPGVYLLSRDGTVAGPLPKRIGHLGLGEFVCPPATDLPTQVIPRLRAEYVAGRPIEVDVDVIAPTPPSSVRLRVRTAGETVPHTFPMSPKRDYAYYATLPADESRAGTVEFSVSVETAVGTTAFPAGSDNAWSARIVPASAPLTLLDPAPDGPLLFARRTSGDQPGGFFKNLPAEGTTPARLHLSAPRAPKAPPNALSLPVKARIRDRGPSLRAAQALRVIARGTGTQLRIALVDADGTTWAGTIAPGSAWQKTDLPLPDLRVVHGFKLPLGYPGNWNIDLPPPARRRDAGATLDLARVEQVQLSVTPSTGQPGTADAAVDVASVQIVFE